MTSLTSSIPAAEAFHPNFDREATVLHLSHFALAQNMLIRGHGGSILPPFPINPSDTLPGFEDWPAKLRLYTGDVTAYSEWGRPAVREGETPWRAMFVQEYAILEQYKIDLTTRSLRSFLGQVLSADHLYTEIYTQRLVNGSRRRDYPHLALRAIAHPPLVQFREAPGGRLADIGPGTQAWRKAAAFMRRLAEVEFNDGDFSQPNDSPF
jgi:hypothetical protein